MVDDFVVFVWLCECFVGFGCFVVVVILGCFVRNLWCLPGSAVLGCLVLWCWVLCFAAFPVFVCWFIAWVRSLGLWLL